MKFTIQIWQTENHGTIANQMALLQEAMAKIDVLKRQRTFKYFNKPAYFKKQYKQCVKKNGIVFVAKARKEIVAFIMGWIIDNTKDLGVYPEYTGFIAELYVLEKFRNLGIGKTLIKKMENYFKKHKCTHTQILCFGPNKRAHKLYQHLGYQDYVYDMFKKI